MLLAKGSIDMDIATTHKERFYDTLDEEKLRTHKKIGDYRETIRLYMRKMTCNNMGSLTELARQHSEESPGYVIQSWMRNRNSSWRSPLSDTFGISLNVPQMRNQGI